MKPRRRRLFEGRKVVDANKDIVVHVEKADIDGSKLKSPSNCAAARAGKRAWHKDVRVFIARAYVRTGNHWTRYLTPATLSRELVSFDRGSAFVPGDYLFKAPCETARLGSDRGLSTRSKTRKKGTPKHFTENVRMFSHV